MLASHGFNYHGVEVLYSGVFGTELTCEIFIGPVYYQRLRHMVSDKFQVCCLLFSSSASAGIYLLRLTGQDWPCRLELDRQCNNKELMTSHYALLYLIFYS